jgi:hypothetical protein
LVEHPYDGDVGKARVSDLAAVVGDLELAPAGEDIEQALRLRDRLEAKISAALGPFDAGRAWDVACLVARAPQLLEVPTCVGLALVAPRPAM